MQQRESSCLTCRTRKVKCDKKQPCSRCVKTNNSSCIYPRQGTLGRPPKNAIFHGKGRNRSGQKLIIREFIFENIGDNQNSNSRKSSNGSSNSSLSGTPSPSTITSGFYVDSEWWILSKEAIQEHHYLNTYYQTIYSFYVIRGLAISERFSTVSYRLPEKPRLKFNTLQLLFTWWTSLSVNLLIKRASQVQLETYSVPSLTLYMFKMNGKSNPSPTATDGGNDQTDDQQQKQQQQQAAHPSSHTLPTALSTSTASLFSSPSSPSLSSISPSSPVLIFPRMHHHHNLSNPLQSLPSEQAINLINEFFLVHPHSVLINKAKLMKDYWADTANPLLLSVIYATTQCFSQLLQGVPVLLWESGTEDNRNPFLNHAHSLLETLPTSPSTSDYQASVILALFEVTFGSPKLGMPLIATTYLMGTQLGLWDKTFKAADAVEEELVNMAFWAVFRATTHGCIEMGTSIVDSLVYHQRPFPPANIHKSHSHQHNTLYNIEPSNRQAYLIESFYSGSVVTHYSGILFACLPKPYINVYGIKTDDSTFEGSELLTMLRTIENVETRLHMVLDDFDQFIQQQRHTWTTLQVYTIETSYRLYRIHFRFLQPTHTCGTRKYIEDLIPAAAIGGDNNNNNNDSCYLHFVIDPADPAMASRLHQVLDDILLMVDELEAILTPGATNANDIHQIGGATLLPHDLMVTVYETSVQLLMLNYQLDPSQLIYDTMTKLLAIAKLLDTYQPPSAAMKNVRQRLKMFMKHHHQHTSTPATAVKEERNHTASPQSDQCTNDGIGNNEVYPIELNLDAQQFFLHPLLQQQQQQHHQYPLIMDSYFPISSSSIPYYHPSQELSLASSSPTACSLSSTALSTSNLPQYPDTQLTRMATVMEEHQEGDCSYNQNNIDTDGSQLPLMWGHPSSFVDWDNMVPQVLHPYEVPLSLLEQYHQDLEYMPFFDM